MVVYSSSSSSFPVYNYFCGDGYLQVGELCDDGNRVSGDGCSATCQIEVLQYCGDNKLDAGEECDDGNTRDGDGCSRFCDNESGVCGNGRLETALGEQCDDGNRVNGDGCSADCRFERSYDCGDGILNRETEQCDSGANNGSGPSSCRENCILPYCGDGILDFSEICDDGNKLNGDSCSALCEIERRAPPPPIVAGLITQTPQVPGLPGQETIPEYEYQVTRVPPPARTPTGPGLVIFLASGAAAGIGFTRRRFRGGK